MKISKTLATCWSLLPAILLTAVLSSTVIAQSATGSIRGTVKDSAGAAIGGAAVSRMRAHAILRLNAPLSLQVLNLECGDLSPLWPRAVVAWDSNKV